MRTRLTAVAPDHFTVSTACGTFDIPFDYGFVCGNARQPCWSRRHRPVGRRQQRKIMNIGDSLSARRIIDGVREGRNVLEILEDMGVLGNREAQQIPF